MPAARLGSMVLAAGLCAGCVPLWPHRYYEPASTEGDVLRNKCWHTHERIVITRGAVSIGIAVVKRDDARFVETSIGVPQGHRVQVGSASVAILDDDARGRVASKLPGVSLADSPNAHVLPIDAMLEGQRFGSTSSGTSRHYWLYAPIDTTNRDRFSVVLPPLAIDGTWQDLPPIDFTRSIHWQFFAPLQC